jgi:hypothetical protein
MNRQFLYPFGLILLSALLGCIEERQTATLCVFTASESGASDPESFDCRVDSTSEDREPSTAEDRTLVRCPAAPIDEGSAYFLRHDLPPDLVPVGTLKIHMETPCETADRDLEETHSDGRVLLPFTPPRGSSCALLVEAVMAQSELSCEVVRPPPAPDESDPCSNLATLCAVPPEP